MLAALLAMATPLCAAQADSQRPSDRIAFGAGLFGVLDDDAGTLDLRFEYRWGWSLWVLKPWAGIEATTDGALFGIVGVLADFDLGSRWVFTPGAGFGPFDAGSGKDLGNPVQFRTQVEFARRFAGDDRFILALSHISNAGLGEINPGTEVFSIYYSIPLGAKSARPVTESPR